jgi:hypothetical protein
MKKILLIILGVLGAAGLMTRVQAQLLNVNFIDDSINVDYGGGNNPAPSAMSGAAVIGASGDIWNGLGGFAYSAWPNGATFTSGTLLYSNGVNSGITLSLSAPSGTYDANSPNWNNHSPFSWASLAAETGNTGYPYTPYAALMASCLIANSTTANGFVTLSGLAPNGVYNLYTYNAGDQNEGGGRASTFTVNGVTQTSTYDGASSTLTLGVDYLEFAGIAASATGTLTINFGNLGGSESDFNGFQLQLVGGTPPPAPPTLSPITNTISGTILCTNTFVTVTAISTSATITNVQAIVQTHGLTGSTNTVTNNLNSSTFGLGTGTVIITNALSTNLAYNLKIMATDNNGNTASTSATFDTMAPVLVIEAEDFNFNSGQFIDTPANGGLALYAAEPLLGTSEVDYQKVLGSGSQGANGSYYRSSDVIINGYASPGNGWEQKYRVAAANGDTTDVPVEVGYNSVNDWLDYTRTFGSGGSAPAGTYTVWSRLATVGGGAALNFYQITGDRTQPNQSSNLLGTFSFTDNGWNTYAYVPLLDAYGNLISVSLSGVQTLRSTVVGNPNIDFYMLMPSPPVLTPALQYAYPDGLHPFEPTNHLTFTVGPANGASIASSGIALVLNGVDVSSGLSLTPSGNSWIASYPIKSNAVYSAVINVTNTAALFSSFPISFDTFNVNSYQWEAVDYDFSTNDGTVWIGGLFIDNPVPTCDITASQTGTFATNSYFGYPTDLTQVNDPNGYGAVAQQGIDIYFPDTQPITSDYYRADGVGTQPTADYLRPKFLAARQHFSDPNIGVLNIGYYNGGNWLNYTRHYPTNTFNVWGRLAGGGGAFSGTTLSLVTSGVGTANQTSNVLGTFSDPNAVGWQAWHWIPLLDANGNMAVVSLGGKATLKVTSGNNLNTEFFMLVPAPLPVQLTASLVAGQIKISIPTETGYTYTVMFTGSLTSPSWSQVGNPIPGDGTVQSVFESTTGLQGYYQVTAQ